MTITIACSRALPLPAIELGGEPVRFAPPVEGEPMPADATIYLSTAVEQVGADVIADMPEGLGLIANLGIGYDNIDLAAAARRGILVSNTPVGEEDTADLAMALMLAACRKLGVHDAYLRAGAWAKGVELPPLGMRVHGAVLGLIGFGGIGQAVARRAAGFGMTILYHARSEKPEAAELGADYRADLADLLAEADIVSIHAPLTDQTRGMIGEKELASFKPGAVLVNTARGALVDEQALIVAISEGRIAAAGLDVFADEPQVPSALLEMAQVVLTPHIGSATAQCRMDIVQRGFSNIGQFVADGTLLDPVV